MFCISFIFFLFFFLSPSSNSSFYFRSILLIDLEILFQLEHPASSPSVPKSLLFSISLSLSRGLSEIVDVAHCCQHILTAALDNKQNRESMIAKIEKSTL